MTDRPATEPAPRRARAFAIALAAAALIAAADLASKWVMAAVVMDPPRVIPVLPFFNLVLGSNRGISFGLLGDLGSSGPAILSALALAIAGLLTIWLWRTTRPGEAAGIVMILGGATGNLVDRIDDGAVTDFLDFYVASYHWPAFNLADTAITTGVVWLFVSSFRSTGSAQRKQLEGR